MYRRVISTQRSLPLTPYTRLRELISWFCHPDLISLETVCGWDLDAEKRGGKCTRERNFKIFEVGDPSSFYLYVRVRELHVTPLDWNVPRRGLTIAPRKRARVSPTQNSPSGLRRTYQHRVSLSSFTGGVTTPSYPRLIFFNISKKTRKGDRKTP